MENGDLEAGLVKCPGCDATWHWVMGDAPSMVCPACGREIPRPAEGATEGEVGFRSLLDEIEEPATPAAPAKEISVEEAMRVLKGHTEPPVPTTPEPEASDVAEKGAEPQSKEVEPPEAEEEPRLRRPIPLPQGVPRPRLRPRSRPVIPSKPPEPAPSGEARVQVRKVRVWTFGAKALVFLLLLGLLGAGGTAGYFYWMWEGTRESRDTEMRAASTHRSRVGELERELKEASGRGSSLSAEAAELKEKLAHATQAAREAVGEEMEELRAKLAGKAEVLAPLEKEAAQAREKVTEKERELRTLREKLETLQKTTRKELAKRKRLEEELARIERATVDLPPGLSASELRYVAARQIDKVKQATVQLEKTARAQKRTASLPKLTRGLELLMSLDVAGAREAFKDAVEAESSWPEANIYLGFALYRLGEDEAASKALKASGPGARGRFHLGEALYSAGDEKGAVDAWKGGAKGDGPFAELCSSNLALVGADAYGAVDRARSALREEASWEAHVALARGLLALGTEKNVAEAGKELRAAAEMQRWDPRPFIALARLRLEQKNARLASSAANWALKLRPSSAEARMVLARVFVLRRRKEAALRELDEAIKLRPSFAPARLERARLLASSEKLDSALRDLDAALGSSPGNVNVLMERARLRGMKGALDGALEDAASAAKKAPRRVDVHILRGDLLCQAGKHTRALKAYADACSLDRLDAGAAGKLVELLLREGTPVRDVRAAVEKAQEIVQITSTTNPDALTVLATALFASGDAAGAARVQREAFTISSRREHYEALQRYEKAARKE